MLREVPDRRSIRGRLFAARLTPHDRRPTRGRFSKERLSTNRRTSPHSADFCFADCIRDEADNRRRLRLAQWLTNEER